MIMVYLFKTHEQSILIKTIFIEKEGKENIRWIDVIINEIK